MRESGMGGRVPGWKEREGAGNVLPILYQDEGEHHLFLENYQQPPCEAPPNTAVNGGGRKLIGLSWRTLYPFWSSWSQPYCQGYGVGLSERMWLGNQLSIVIHSRITRTSFRN